MKQKSDIVRDKIIEARDIGEDGIFLTDDEACDLWSTLESVESDISAMELRVKQVLESNFERIKRSLHNTQTQVKQVKAKMKTRKR